MTIEPLIFIGYDDRQPLAYEVCKKSIEKTSSVPVHIYPLEHRDLRKKGLFTREWVVDGSTGRFKDKIDDMFFSNQFSQTRFLTPFYANYLGFHGQPCMFVDCDFVFLQDVKLLFEQVKEQNAPISCVKHEYNPENKVKMDGQQQTNYPKKLWSSLMIFNPLCPGAQLYPQDVNTKKSSWLHRMEWVDEENIGTIDERWNFIPGHSDDRVRGAIGAIHYTEGLPTMSGYETCKYSGCFTKVAKTIHSGTNKENVS